MRCRFPLKRGVILLWALILVFTFTCVPQAAPISRSKSNKTQIVTPRKAENPKPNWEEEWAKTKAEALKEGRLMIYGSAGPAVRDLLTKYFLTNYNIQLEWVSGRTPELVRRLSAEHQAGIYVADVYLSGVGPVVIRKDKVLQSLDPILSLPEVLDRKAWWGGDLIYIDEEHTWVGILAFPQPTIFVNTNLVKPEEVKTYKDLLNPKWKGKMVVMNPRSGAGLAWAYHVSEVIMSPDYLREFVKQEPIVVDNSRQQCEWVARGKYPIAVAVRTEDTNSFIELGAPVELISAQEGVHLTSSAGGVGLFKKAPHPNAAKLFINWALTREGGTMFSKLVGGQSARLDVPTDFLQPAMVRKPGQKYFNTITERHNQNKQNFAKKALEIFKLVAR